MQDLLIPVIFVLTSYLVGGFSPGYWLVRLKTGRDIRQQGSGGTGATNVGRLLGKGGFTIVFLGDSLKGALMIKLALFQYTPASPWIHAVAFAVIAGHIWPVQLGFRGGKGISTLFGAWLVLAPLALVPCILLALLSLLLSRRVTLSGLAGLLALPPSVYFLLSHNPWILGFASLSLLIVLFAHREHLSRLRTPNTQ